MDGFSGSSLAQHYKSERLGPFTFCVKSNVMASLIRAIFSRVSSWTILCYMTVSAGHACYEMSTGIKTNSLGLISNAFHTFCDCSGLIVGLIAAGVIHAQWEPNLKYTYGYGRADTVAGLANALFLLFISFLICGEAVQRILSAPPVKAESLFNTVISGVGLNLVGLLTLWFSWPAHHMIAQHNVEGDEENDEDSQFEIRKGMLWHVVSDLLGSLGVLVSSHLVETYGWTIADPVCSLVIAVIIMFGIVPFLKESINIVMQRSPQHLDKVIPKFIQSVEHLKVGNLQVVAVVEPHFWVLHSNYYIASLTLRTNTHGTEKETNTLTWAVRELLKEWRFKRWSIEYEAKDHPMTKLSLEPGARELMRGMPHDGSQLEPVTSIYRYAVPSQQ